MCIKEKIEKKIREAEFKLEALPQSYFIEYFEKDFLKELKKYLQNNEKGIK